VVCGEYTSPLPDEEANKIIVGWERVRVLWPAGSSGFLGGHAGEEDVGSKI